MFTDSISVKVVAGRGGHGLVSWRREKYVPKGGPTGGNGGRGGNILVQGNENLISLDAFRTHRLLKAPNGQSGGPNQRQGGRGEDLILEVPCGTLVKDAHTSEILFDITEHGQTELLCEGGPGGRGNASFKTSVKQAPNYATSGREGQSKDIELDLKVIADVGLVGFPNAGKSTLMNQLTKANVRCEAYPFTTLTPNIGFIESPDYLRYSIADIPGIIEGAHQNKGLGIEFLKHIERTKMLFFVLDATSENPLEDFAVLCQEIEAYDSSILKKPAFILLNKTDLMTNEEVSSLLLEDIPFPIFKISALENEGLKELKKALFHLMDSSEAKPVLV